VITPSTPAARAARTSAFLSSVYGITLRPAACARLTNPAASLTGHCGSSTGYPPDCASDSAWALAPWKVISAVV
jgi:hypothetical protein